MNGDTGWLRPRRRRAGRRCRYVLLGACLGAGNGAAITRLRMPPFIVTLTTHDVLQRVGHLADSVEKHRQSASRRLMHWARAPELALG